ncbi:MAG: hypothetical protein ACD_13C00140G0008 [uncultured bacterium]|uniref:Uncharacterized protein n=1 Tax=Candidatus Woesebacteria bacterium GW2011_GWF1_40_24 TaxID=1618601 RepID=A0A0G0RU14_9BACT|nr:MAG: hypothetical protein ACD_13C00140G0008 [uncultured bacterium]KKR53152.1 MAG: hypothetical protein UT88_C0013G0005 [Candidatus Woesebacteria bacterium GW2011_GWD2_40_19]KKR56144.1 MAG: hypothetical protein UT93_C0004G0022 [Candidatus Woesebacteria bacterium GW2011_GWF1_40_24]KKR57478.1 MAG: hypothetical protein UT96_C0019G0007 [Candidatus Woesebacteria bacterium GW2011_GWC2_40_30]HAU65639.1 hypothetical protein [Candidatus Woesebacteria bacterium]
MPITPEEFRSFPEPIKTCLEQFNVTLVLEGNFPEDLYKKPIAMYLPNITAELVDNCVEKGAKRVVLTTTSNSMKIEDDVIETYPEKTLRLLNKIKSSCKPISTKDLQRKGTPIPAHGGIGIFQTMNFLKRVGGDLNYYIVNQKIVAEVTWE